MTVSEQITLAAIFYFRQVFVFCKLVNENVLERVALTFYKEHTHGRSTNLLSRNHPKLSFSLRSDGCQMSNTVH